MGWLCDCACYSRLEEVMIVWVGFYWLGFGYVFEDDVRQWFVVFFLFCFARVGCLVVILVWMFSVSLGYVIYCWALLIVLLWWVGLFCRFWLLVWFGCGETAFLLLWMVFCLRCFFCVKIVVLSFVVVDFFYASVDLSFVIFACVFVLVWRIECWIGNMFCFIVYVVCTCFNSVVWYLFSFLFVLLVVLWCLLCLCLSEFSVGVWVSGMV